MGRHANAPLTPEGRRRLCERVDAGRPISHVAAEAGISRLPTTLFRLGTVDWVDGTASGFEIEKPQEQEQQLGLFDLEPTS